MRFHVLGLGSIGSLLSHHLRRILPPPHTVTLIHKNHVYVQQAHENGGIRVERDGVTSMSTGFLSENFNSTYKTFTAAPLSSQGEGEKDPSIRIESLFITTKAYHTLSAIRSLLPRLSSHSTIVLMQNGMGIYEELVQQVFPNPQSRPHFILASNTHGAFMKSRFNIVHSGVGEIQFGIMEDPMGRDFEAGFFDENVPTTDRRPRLSDISLPTDPSSLRYQSLRNTVAAMLLLDPLHTSWLPMQQIQTAMKRKVVVNSVINPLTAILNCKNGDLFSTRSALSIMRKVCNEAQLVYSAHYEAGMETFSEPDSSPIMSKLGQLPTGLTAASLEEECLRVAKLTRNNISSMLVDVRNGRPTEIGYMNGYLINAGREFGIGVPVTRALANLVNMRSAIPMDQSF